MGNSSLTPILQFCVCALCFEREAKGAQASGINVILSTFRRDDEQLATKHHTPSVQKTPLSYFGDCNM